MHLASRTGTPSSPAIYKAPVEKYRRESWANRPILLGGVPLNLKRGAQFRYHSSLGSTQFGLDSGGRLASMAFHMVRIAWIGSRNDYMCIIACETT